MVWNITRSILLCLMRVVILEEGIQNFSGEDFFFFFFGGGRG